MIFLLYISISLYISIIQEVANLEAQRRAFTSRVPRIKAESEAFRGDQSRAEAGTIESRGAGKEESMSSLPMVFVDEDQDPDDGVNIFDVEANIAAARTANAAAAAAASSGAEPSSVDTISGESLQPEEPQRGTGQAESDASFPRETRETASHLPQSRTLQSDGARDDLSLRPIAPSSVVKSGAGAAGVSSDGEQRSSSQELRASGDRGVQSQEGEDRGGGSRRERARAAAVAAAQQNASLWGGVVGLSSSSSSLGARTAGSSSRRVNEDAERMAKEAEELAEMLEEDDAFEAGWTG